MSIGQVLNGFQVNFQVSVFEQGALPVSEVASVSSFMISNQLDLFFKSEKITHYFEDPIILDRSQFLQRGGNAEIEALEIWGPKKVHCTMKDGSRLTLDSAFIDFPGCGPQALRQYLRRSFISVTQIGERKFQIRSQLGLAGGGKMTSLHKAVNRAINSGNLKKVTKIVESKVKTGKLSIDALSASGCTPLYYACGGFDKKASFDVTQLLVESGANPQTPNMAGKFLPIHVAAQHGHYEIAEYLLPLSGDINVASADGSTTLFFACTFEGKCNVKFIERLVQMNAAIDYASQKGYTPLMAAAQEGHDDVVRYLVSQGADVNHTAKTGSTALSFACQLNPKNIPLVRFLLESGADPEILPSTFVKLPDDVKFVLEQAAKQGRKSNMRLLDQYRPYEEADQRRREEEARRAAAAQNGDSNGVGGAFMKGAAGQVGSNLANLLFS